MTQTLILNTVALPLFVGLILAAVIHFSPLKASALTIVATLGVLVLYYLLEGFPPLPPVSSKHKIPYLLVVIGCLGAAVGLRHKVALPAISVGLGLIALGWIGQRKISSDPLQAEILLALLPVLGLGISTSAPRAYRADLFLWPGAVLSLAIGGSLVSVLGGYIGLAQMLGACAALTGGYLIVSFVRVKLMGRDASGTHTEGANWMLLATVAVVLISIALFASKLSPMAFAVLCLIFVAPFAAARHLKMAAWYGPIVMGVYALVPAILAIGIAWLNAA